MFETVSLMPRRNAKVGEHLYLSNKELNNAPHFPAWIVDVVLALSLFGNRLQRYLNEGFLVHAAMGSISIF